MKRERIVLACMILVLLALFTGCMTQPEETQPATTTVMTEPPTEATTEPPTEPPVEPPMELLLDVPAEEALLTMEETFLVTGTADPRYPLQIDGNTISADEEGSFSYEARLEPGENQIRLSYLDQRVTYTVERRYTTAWYSHEEDTEYCSGATIYAGLFAREGSTVTATFQGKTTKVSPSVNQLGSGAPEGFVYYACQYTAPSKKAEPVDLGPITYTVTYGDVTEAFTTGNITCAAAVEMKRSDPEATPDAAGYRDVGSGYIVEIVDINAETFEGHNTNDTSMPTMNYLPKGTLDYGSQGVYYNSSARRYYHLLRCGVRVYKSNDNKPLGMASVVDCYNGLLPDHNEINVAELKVEEHFTHLVLDCLWKAPFFFDEEAQAYYREDWHRYQLDTYDAGYVDITFCYATVFTGSIEIPEDNPLFSHAELIENEADHTLRLYLKKEGGFYGWNAYYNENDQLCFKFLNPVTVEQADNAYGADLTGIKVMIDVGHGGQDPGATYSDSKGHVWEEAERNLTLSHLVREELESIGATVVMNRTEDVTIPRTARIAYLLQEAPDYCICIHHNADLSKDLTGFDSWYFTAFSNPAAKHILQTNEASGAYKATQMYWHYYFMARQTACPIVLAENGHMSNKWEMDRIGDPEIMKLKAQAITRGIVNYYLELSGYPVEYDTNK